MRKSKFAETQIVGILKDAESGVPVPDLISQPRPDYFSDHGRAFGWPTKTIPLAAQTRAARNDLDAVPL
jgi:hypothetical protein